MRRRLLSALAFCAILFSSLLCSNLGQALGAASRRAKCAIECYTKCAQSGTPKAVYCNCPVNTNNNSTNNSHETMDECNSVNEVMLTEKTMERLIEAESGYKDVRTIWLRVEPVPNAFIYIFEFSVQSADRPIWTFAGASSAPQITLSIPDACRDYQFRLLVVIRATDPQEWLVVFRPKPIPAQFPPFIVPKESIHMDRPKESSDGQTLHISVSWQHPPGHDDADIYGYSPPTAYPIRCQIPEDLLSQPRLELVHGGARLHLALPMDVLQERCRIYMEVRMMPRCVRIEPFDIQISVELDCQKFPNLRYCKREQAPQCTDVVDLWGKENGRAIVVWQRPNSQQQQQQHEIMTPLYYILNWGPAQSQGSPPFMTHRIVQSQEIHVPGNVTNAELWPQIGVQYGLQICAFYGDRGAFETPQSDPFRIVAVIPFTCTQCQGRTPQGCIDCSKIEQQIGKGGNSGGDLQMPSIVSTTWPQSAVPQPDPVACIGPICSSANRSSVHYISSDTVVLDVFGAKVSVASSSTTRMPSQITTEWKMDKEGEEEEETKNKAPNEMEEDGQNGGGGGAWIGQGQQKKMMDEEEDERQPPQLRHSKTHLAKSPIRLTSAEEGQQQEEAIEPPVSTSRMTISETNEPSLRRSTTSMTLSSGPMEFSRPSTGQDYHHWATTAKAVLTLESMADGSTKGPPMTTALKCDGDNGEKEENLDKLDKLHTHNKPNETNNSLPKKEAASSSAGGGSSLDDIRKDEEEGRASLREDKMTRTTMKPEGKSAKNDGEDGKSQWEMTGKEGQEHKEKNGEKEGPEHKEENADEKAQLNGNGNGKNGTTMELKKLDIKKVEEVNAAASGQKEGMAFSTAADNVTTATALNLEEESGTRRKSPMVMTMPKQTGEQQHSPMPLASTTSSTNANDIPQEAGEEEEDQGHEAFGGTLRAMDPQKLMLAGPVFFLLGLIVGVALFCSAFIRRRRNRRHHSSLPSYSASSLRRPLGGGGGKNYGGANVGGIRQSKFPARSVLAARTAAAGGAACYGPANGGGGGMHNNGATIGFIGTPIGTIATTSLVAAGSGSPAGSHPSCAIPSSNTSTASSAATVESHLGGSTGNGKHHQQHHHQQHQQQQPKGPIQIHHPLPQPPPPNANANNAHNYYADNTARFFMHHPGSKNVHF